MQKNLCKLALKINRVHIFHPSTLDFFHAMSRSLRSCAPIPLFMCTHCLKTGEGVGGSHTLPRPLLKNAVGADDLG